MGKIVSPSGVQIFQMKSVGTDSEGFVIFSTMGVWDAEIHLSYKEMVGAFLRPKALLAMLKIPIFLVSKGLFKRKGK